MATRIKIDSPPEELTFPGGKPTLEEAQEAVGGYVELIHVTENSQLLVDEDGTPKGLKHNAVATLIAGRKIVGTALLLRDGERWI